MDKLLFGLLIIGALYIIRAHMKEKRDKEDRNMQIHIVRSYWK